MIRLVEVAPKGIGKLHELSTFLPAGAHDDAQEEISEENRPTTWIVIDERIVILLGMLMIEHFSSGYKRRRLLVMIDATMGWVEENSVS